ncbi:hypothetical protein BaRGS_00009357, partial [Batillaria attramentaria]
MMERRGASHFIAALIVVVYLQPGDASAVVQVNGNTGTFLSYNYPNNYPPNLDVEYRAIFTTSGPQQNDYVTIQGGYKRCGGPSAYTTYVTVPGNQLTVFFHTTGSYEYPGFNITYTVIEGTCQTTMSVAGSSNIYWLPITDMPGRQTLVFSVRACDTVNVGLGKHQGSPFLNMWLIKIGDSSNTQSVLKKCTANSCSQEAAVSHSPLSCCEFRSFWLKWDNSAVFFGTGNAISQATSVLSATSSWIEVVWVFIGSASSFLVTPEAPLLDFYCGLSPDLTLPSSCQSTPVPIVSTTAATTSAEVTTQGITSPVPVTTVDPTTEDTTVEITTADVTTEETTAEITTEE